MKKLKLNDVPNAVDRARKHLDDALRITDQIRQEALDSKVKDLPTGRRYRMAKLVMGQIAVAHAMLWELPGLDWKMRTWLRTLRQRGPKPSRIRSVRHDRSG